LDRTCAPAGGPAPGRVWRARGFRGQLGAARPRDSSVVCGRAGRSSRHNRLARPALGSDDINVTACYVAPDGLQLGPVAGARDSSLQSRLPGATNSARSCLRAQARGGAYPVAAG
ncbi:MAG: hypothetical protein M3256_20085, partial [Actinomycetota bacterium]|nr:hypothetical protein [Actinomycetota bacterium]